MDGLAEDEFCRFRPPKSVQEEDSLLVQSKPKKGQTIEVIKFCCSCVLLFIIDFQTPVFGYPNTLFFTSVSRCIHVT